MVVDIGMGHEGHSCADDFDVWVLWEVVGFLGVRVQNA